MILLSNPALAEGRLQVCPRSAVLVIDKIGYSQLNRQEAELFFRQISLRYEHGSVILTSNKYFSSWSQLLSNSVLATVLLDRLLHYVHIINSLREAYRLRDRLKAGIQTAPLSKILAEPYRR